MSWISTNAKRALLAGELDFDAQTFRVALLMTNTSLAAAGQEDVATVAGFTTLDESNGANYARQQLAGLAVTADNANNRALFDANDAVFATLGQGTRNLAGALLFRFVTNDADSVPVAWFDAAPFPFAANGLDLTLRWNAVGIIALT